MLKFKKETKAEKEQRQFEDAVDETEFVPYAGFFDPFTILTKNGELIQIIKITNFGYDLSDEYGLDLREALRQAIERRIRTTSMAFWIHTIRRKKDLSLQGEY